ncbi:MAG: CoA-binding protein [Thiotrichales bacterium]
MSETVLVVGASPKPDRYSNKAIRALLANGHRPIPLHPREAQIENLDCVPNVAAVSDPVDTVTLYVNPQRQSDLMPDIVALKPRRVIFNPGTENPVFQQVLSDNAIPWEEACTLVLLSTKQF